MLRYPLLNWSKSLYFKHRFFKSLFFFGTVLLHPPVCSNASEKEKLENMRVHIYSSIIYNRKVSLIYGLKKLMKLKESSVKKIVEYPLTLSEEAIEEIEAVTKDPVPKESQRNILLGRKILEFILTEDNIEFQKKYVVHFLVPLWKKYSRVFKSILSECVDKNFYLLLLRKAVEQKIFDESSHAHSAFIHFVLNSAHKLRAEMDYIGLFTEKDAENNTLLHTAARSFSNSESSKQVFITLLSWIDKWAIETQTTRAAILNILEKDKKLQNSFPKDQKVQARLRKIIKNFTEGQKSFFQKKPTPFPSIVQVLCIGGSITTAFLILIGRFFLKKKGFRKQSKTKNSDTPSNEVISSSQPHKAL